MAAPRISCTMLNEYVGKQVTLVGTIDENKQGYAILKESQGIATLRGRDFPTQGIVQVRGTVNSQLNVEVDDYHIYDYSGPLDESLQLYATAIQ